MIKAHVLFSRKSILFSFAAVFFFFSCSPFASNVENFTSIERFSINTGLPDVAIFSIDQDQAGFLWLGTPSGLVRYDSNEFRNYSHSPKSIDQIPVNISKIFIDSKGRRWLGSWGEGLTVYSHDMKLLGVYKKGNYKSNLQSNKIQTFYEDSDGDIWVGTNGGGLALYDKSTDSFKNYLFNSEDENSLSHNRVWAIVEPEVGKIWIATSDGLNKLDKKTNTFTRFFHNESIPQSINDSLVRTLFVDSNKNLWVGTGKGAGIFDINTQQFKDVMPNSRVKNIAINKIVEDKDKNIWIGTYEGMYRYELTTEKFSTLSPKNEYKMFSNDDIRDIYINASNIMWIATRHSGLIKVSSDPVLFENIYEYLTKTDSIETLKGVKDILMDHTNKLWISTLEGVFYQNEGDKKFVKFQPSNPLSNLSFNVIVENKKGELWLGGYTGIYKIGKDRNTITSQNFLLDGIKIKSIYLMVFDKKDTLWVGTAHSGLLEINKNKTKIYTKEANRTSSLANNSISAIFIDSINRVWVGTKSTGISRLDSNRSFFTHYTYSDTTKNSINDNAVHTIYQDTENNVWIGTRKGLNRYNTDTDSFEHYRMYNGLTFENVRSIIEDDYGGLWLSTGKGISFLDISTKHRTNFNFNNDLVGSNFLGRAAHKMKNGALLFGGTNGIKKVIPSGIKQNKGTSLVLITDVWVDNKPIPQYLFDHRHSVNVAFGVKSLQIKFTTINNKHLDDTIYSYRLVGFDENWNKSNELRTASYTNLDPGNYTFEVKNNNAIIPLSSSVEIIIHSPWWKLWWAYTIYAMIISGIIWIFIRIHRNKVLFERDLNQQLEKKVSERTADLLHANHQLEEISLTDQLTGLKNRRFLLNNIQSDINLVLRKYHDHISGNIEEVNEGADLIFFLIDFDHFKRVNDEFGHTAGDAVLIQIKFILEQVFRETDYLVRWGGEEFLVIARFSDRDRAPELSERLRKTVAEYQFDIGQGHMIKKTCSIGYACFPFIPNKPEKLEWERIVDIADHCLYAAKNSNRNAWVGLTYINSIEDDLFLNVTQRTQELIDINELKVMSSILDKSTIKWD